MGPFGGPQGRAMGLETTRQVPEPCPRREALRPGLAGKSTSRWETRRGAGGGGARDRGGMAAAEGSGKGLGASGGSRLRNRWRRGRALAGTVFVSAMTLSQGENKREGEQRGCDEWGKFRNGSGRPVRGPLDDSSFSITSHIFLPPGFARASPQRSGHDSSTRINPCPHTTIHQTHKREWVQETDVCIGELVREKACDERGREQSSTPCFLCSFKSPFPPA